MILGILIVIFGVVALFFGCRYGLTRPSGGGKSAGYARRSGPPVDAEASVADNTGAADTAPESAGPLSGATPGDWAYGVNVLPGTALPYDDTPTGDEPVCQAEASWHPYRCTEVTGHAGKHRAGEGDNIVAEWQDPIARHIDTAAALLQPDAPHLPFSEFDAAVPSKPITEEEDRDWRGIVRSYGGRGYKGLPFVPGRSEP